MAIQVQGNAGVIAEVDGNRNIFKRRGTANYGTVGGAFSVTGGPSTAVAATLAASTTLMSLRHGAAATSNLYMTRLRVMFAPSTVGASATIPGQIAWQRFTTATPTTGTARTPARCDLSTGSGTQVADVRDSASALTVTSVVFGDVLASANVPVFTTGMAYEWIVDLDEDEFYRLTAGDGICLRTQVVMPATQTWVYSYTIHYLEK
jgi:hypothetical protein